MSESQLRVKLFVAAGIVGASLLGATFVGCQSGPSSGSNSPFASYNGSPMAPGGGMPQGYGQMPQGAVAGYSQQNQQALLAEAQRQGAQQGLSAQDVVAMSRSGMPDTQIAIAIQQRGANLRATPGVGSYLAQNGVNPAVLQGPTASAGYPGFGAQAPGAMASTYQPQAAQVAQAGNFAAPGMTAGMPQAGAGMPGADGGVQSAGYQVSGAAPSYDASGTGAAPGQSWRPMSH
jgi:hypothetical protein